MFLFFGVFLRRKYLVLFGEDLRERREDVIWGMNVCDTEEDKMNYKMYVGRGDNFMKIELGMRIKLGYFRCYLLYLYNF